MYTYNCSFVSVVSDWCWQLALVRPALQTVLHYFSVNTVCTQLLTQLSHVAVAGWKALNDTVDVDVGILHQAHVSLYVTIFEGST